MKKKLFFVLVFGVLFTTGLKAEDYKSTDNEGMSKQERIDHMDEYLKNISNSVKSIESKLDSNNQKIKIIDESVQALKLDVSKLKASKNNEPSNVSKKELTKENQKEKNSPEVDELAKIKSDIESIKLKDISKLRNQINNLSDTLEAVQATLRSK